jgi:hypothetical protein
MLEQDLPLLHFQRTVLCHYRASADLYCLEEDDMGGELSTRSDSAGPWVSVRFAFRRLADMRVCVAALGFDVEKLPAQDRLVWRGHLIPSPIFAEDDPAFSRWVKRNLEGSWDVEDGPKVQVERYVRLLRALTRQTLGRPLWRYAENPLVNYPAAENTDAYAKAHLELYRLLIDGLDSSAIGILAGRLEVSLSEPQLTLNSLKELLPPELIPKIHVPLKRCSDERNRNHGVPEQPARSLPAFDLFHRDLEGIAAGLCALNDWLQRYLSADSEACLRREEAMVGLFPKLVSPPRPEFKLDDLRQAEGKTIRSVEFGEVASRPDVHESEAIVLHFTDGSSLCIRVGSNVLNLVIHHAGLSPSDFCTDLMVFWAPATSTKLPSDSAL